MSYPQAILVECFFTESVSSLCVFDKANTESIDDTGIKAGKQHKDSSVDEVKPPHYYY
jgi:hypothetical protein